MWPEGCQTGVEKKRQGRPPAVPNLDEMGCLLALVYDFLEFDARSKFGNSAGSDLDGRSRLRVPAIAGLALRDGKRAETNQGYPISLAKCGRDALHSGVNCGRRLRLGNTAGASDPVNEIGFVHALS